MEECFAVSAGANIRYRIYGNGNTGETVFFLHGNGESGMAFEGSALFYEKRGYRAVTVDSRGHGDSDLGGEPLTIPKMAEDVYAVFNALRVPRAAVIGFSDGANIAMVLAGVHPERVSKLVLYGGNYNNSGLSMPFRISAKISCMLAKAAAKLDEEAMRSYKVLALMTDDQHIEEATLKKITAKTLVLSGEKDLIKKAHTEKIASLIPNSECEILKGHGHFYPLKCNDDFNEKTEKFLKEP